MDTIIDLVTAFGPLFTLFRIPLLFILLLFLVRVSFKLYKNTRLAKSGIAELDKLGGEDFEKYLEILFRKLGYKVTRTPYQGDYGADLVLQKDGVQTVVQAKRYNRSVGVKAIQEAVAATKNTTSVTTPWWLQTVTIANRQRNWPQQTRSNYGIAIG